MMRVIDPCPSKLFPCSYLTFAKHSSTFYHIAPAEMSPFVFPINGLSITDLTTTAYIDFECNYFGLS